MDMGRLAAAAAAVAATAVAVGATGASAAAAARASSSSSSMLLPLATVTPLARHSPASSAAAAFCLPPLAPAAVRGRGAAATTGPWRLQRGRQLLRMFDQGGGGGGGEQPPPPQPVQRRRGPGIRGGSSGGGKAALKAEQELWEARRAISRGVLRPVAKLVQRKEKLLRERLARGEGAAAAQQGEDMRNAVVATALLLAVVTAVARLGGRATVLGMMGLDMLQDADIAGRLDSVLTGVEGLGPLKLPAFLLLWVVAKTLCVDALALVLALASGVIFGGVLEGALYSTACATLASLVGFQLARTLFRKQVVAQLQKRPLLRALERAVAKDGIKAVFTFRLSPLVPALPIGGYSYLYGVSSISAPEFMAGIFAGSLKPYFLDAYLGVWGKEILAGDGAALDAGQSALLFLAFFALVLVGTLAAQIAGRAFDEAKTEALLMTGAPGGGAVWEEEGQGADDGWDWFTMLGIERPKNGLVVDEWRRLDRAVREEWRGVLAEEEEAAQQQQQQQQQPQAAQGGGRAPPPPSPSYLPLSSNPQKAAAPPTTDHGVDIVPPYLDFDPAGQRPPRPLRKPPQLTTTMVGLVLFPFVLLGTATGKLGDAVSSSPSTASTSLQPPAGAGGEEEEEEEGGGNNDSSSYPPPTVML